MKIILDGTNHYKDEEDIEIGIEYEGEDTWTFTSDKIDFTITDLKEVMEFLKNFNN